MGSAPSVAEMPDHLCQRAGRGLLPSSKVTVWAPWLLMVPSLTGSGFWPIIRHAGCLLETRLRRAKMPGTNRRWNCARATRGNLARDRMD